MKNEHSSRPGASCSMGYLTFVCVVAALGGLLFGFDTVVIGKRLYDLHAARAAFQEVCRSGNHRERRLLGDILQESDSKALIRLVAPHLGKVFLIGHFGNA
ncbi:MAG: hypothetical protein ACOYM3_19570 [Terrimicrobiaceae bacterium]